MSMSGVHPWTPGLHVARTRGLSNLQKGVSMKTERSNATSRRITPPLKWHREGGKTYLADWIINLMPPRCRKPNAPDADDPGWLAYVEPYFGGGAVLLANDPKGISEVVNDKNEILTDFWTALADAELFTSLQRLLQTVPFSEVEYAAAVEGLNAIHRSDFASQGGIRIKGRFLLSGYRSDLYDAHAEHGGRTTSEENNSPAR